MQTNSLRWILPLLLSAFVWLGGCTALQSTSQPSPEQPAATETPAGETAQSPASPAPAGLDPRYASLPRLEGEATVEMIVKGARIVMQLNGTEAPLTAGNFVDLVNRGVYDGLAFHRVVRQPQPFVVQGGDPQSKDPNFPAANLGTGGFDDPITGAPRFIPLEIQPADATTPVYGKTLQQAGITQPPALRHTRGAVAMARSQLPNSASSQFYITLADLNFLDGNYAVFGSVTSGMEVVDQIQQGDRIDSARVTAGLENLRNGAAPTSPEPSPGTAG